MIRARGKLGLELRVYIDRNTTERRTESKGDITIYEEVDNGWDCTDGALL